MTKDSLIEFPCHFPVKIMGNNTSSFIEEIMHIAKRHFPNFEQEHLTHKMSKNNNYLAITATVFAENQEMLDSFYREITLHPDVKMVL